MHNGVFQQIFCHNARRKGFDKRVMRKAWKWQKLYEGCWLQRLMLTDWDERWHKLGEELTAAYEDTPSSVQLIQPNSAKMWLLCSQRITQPTSNLDCSTQQFARIYSHVLRAEQYVNEGGRKGLNEGTGMQQYKLINEGNILPVDLNTE